MDPTFDVRNKLATFLDCELDCNSGLLNVAGKHQKLEPMVHQFLLLLIQHQGSIVSKQKVLDTLWENKSPTDEVLRALVKKAREALKDNARSPTYIKTIPTKGYLLIPVVELSSTVVQSWLLQHAKLIMWAAVVVLVSICLASWYFYSSSQTSKHTNRVTLTETNIGIINQNKVGTYYINNALKNVWVEDLELNNYSQLKISDIATKFQQKIAFSTSLTKQIWFSRGSQRILVMRNDRSGFYAIQFKRQAREPNIFEYKVSLPADTVISALDYDGNHLYVISTVNKSLGLFELETGELVKTASIVSIQKELQVTKTEFFNTKTQNVTITAWPSPVSSGLVVSFDFSNRTRLLYYPNVNAAEPASVIDITGGLQSAVWNKEGKRFSFTDSNAKLLAYQVDEGKLTSFNTNGQPVNQVVADCGSNCFVVANTQGIPKLSEFSNPFTTELQYSDSEREINPHAQIIETNSIARNEYLPQYINQGLYFVSQKESKTELIFRDSSNQENVVYRFDTQATVEELRVNSGENYLAGVVNQRPFLLDLNTLKLSYIPLTFPHVSHIAFSANNMITFYAETTALIESNQNSMPGVTANKVLTNAGQPNGLYQYNLGTRQVKLLEANVKAQRSIELLDITDKGSNRYNATLRLTNNDEVIVSFQNNRQATVLDIGTNDCANCWHVKGNYLYQINPNSNNGVSSIMTRVNLLTGEQTQQDLLFSDLLNTFSMHQETNKIMVTTRQNLQTELTKIEGLVQVY